MQGHEALTRAPLLCGHLPHTVALPPYAARLPALPAQVVPILRAGLVLLEQTATVLPVTQTYHVGYVRDDNTLEVGARCAVLCCGEGGRERGRKRHSRECLLWMAGGSLESSDQSASPRFCPRLPCRPPAT